MIGQIHDVDLRLLRVFRTVARCGGLAAARAELNLSLPTISLQVKQLEERLGIRLCQRGNAGFSVTPQGEAVLRAAERLLASVEAFDGHVAGLREVPLGEVRLGVMSNLMSNPSCRIHEAIASMRGKAPGVAVSLLVASPSDLQSQILNGTLHAAVGLFFDGYPTLEYSELFEERHLLYCSPAHPLYRDAEARDFDLKVLQGAGYASWADQDAFVQSPFPLSPQTSSPFMDGIACLILSGQYIGYLPEYFAERWVAQGLLRPLWSTATSRTARIVVVRRKADAMKRATSLMVETLLEAHSTSRGPVAAPVA